MQVNNIRALLGGQGSFLELYIAPPPSPLFLNEAVKTIDYIYTNLRWVNQSLTEDEYDGLKSP